MHVPFRHRRLRLGPLLPELQRQELSKLREPCDDLRLFGEEIGVETLEKRVARIHELHDPRGLP